ncbi:MAG: acyltransferase [Ruminococcaceae bacterium]|nr:acyltransferase [Oscillospiraceae bacterium]
MKRNYGIDALRMLSMFMIAMLHVLGQGGMLGAAEENSVKYWILWFLELACFCSANCFALISGYVMYKSKAKLSRALSLWLQVVFYTVGATIVFLVIKPKVVGLGVVADAIFPVSRMHYWYISAYFGLLVLQPLLNLIMEHAEKKLLERVLLTVFVLFCTVPTFLKSDPYLLGGGYTMAWLILLYLAGAYIHKYDVAEKIKKSTAWLVFGITLLVTFGYKMGMQLFPQNILPTGIFKNVLASYNAPTTIIMAVALLIALSKQDFGTVGRKVIAWCAPAALGVYLLHTNKLVWQFVIKGFSKCFVEYHWAVMILLALAAALVIYVVCTLAEKLRIWLFKLVKLDVLCQKVAQWVDKILNKYIPV